MNNIAKICPCCSQKRKAKVQENVVDKIQGLLENAKAFHVKIAFSDENGTEHMWVKSYCIDFKGRKLLGVLDNDPVVVKNMQHGNKVEVSFCDIEDILEDDYARETGNTLSRVQ